MALIVSLAGMAVAAIGVLGMAAPGQLVHLLGRRRFLTLLPVTVVLRIGLGALFLVAAPDCRLPDLVRAMGVLEIAGAIVLLVLGPGRLRRFVDWWLARPSSFVRGWCSAALVFGVLIVYAGA